MKKILFALAIAVGLPLAAYAQGIPLAPGSQESMKESVIELKDGTRIIHNANGTMHHVNEKGDRLSMKGKMEAKDGSVYIMKDDYVWKRIAKGEHPHNP